MPSIDARYAFWLAPFMSAEEARYYIGGIYIEPCPAGGATLVATDGHVMGVVHDERAETDRAVIWKPSKDLLAAGRAASKKSEPCAISLSERDGGPIDGTYPDWRRVIPAPNKVAPVGCISFNASLLHKFSNMLGNMSGVNIESTGDGAPMIVTAPSRPNFYGVIMPMRMGAPNKKLPAWMGIKPRVRVKALKAAA